MVYIAGITILVIFIVETFVVGVTYHSLKIRFRWKVSAKKSFLFLFVLYAIFDNYILPLLFAVDLRFTIGNETITKLIDTPEAVHSLEFFNPGIFEFFLYSFHAFLAGTIIPKILNEKSWQYNTSFQQTANPDSDGGIGEPKMH